LVYTACKSVVVSEMQIGTLQRITRMENDTFETLMNTLIGRQDPVDETSETLRLAMINLQIATDNLKPRLPS